MQTLKELGRIEVKNSPMAGRELTRLPLLELPLTSSLYRSSRRNNGHGKASFQRKRKNFSPEDITPAIEKKE